MRSIVRGIVALFAAFLMMDAVQAAPTIVSPADYSTVSTMTEKFKGYLDASGFTSSFETSDYYKNQEFNPDSVRVAKRLEFFENSAPVTVKWSGSVGTSTVKIWRTNKDTSSTPVFTKTTTGNSATFYDLEIGRNYTWTVTDSTGTATGHFYTSRYAPRMIKQVNETAGSACSNGRDIGGRMTEDGTKAIKQGLIYRTAQLEYCNPRNATTGVFEEMSWLKNTLGIKLDIDLRLKSHLEENYVGANHKKWTEEEVITNDTNNDIPDDWVGKYKYRYIWKNSSYLDIDESNIGDGVVRYCVNTTTGREFPSWKAFFSSDANRKSVWIAFNAIYESVKKGEPVIFHCSHGKDRGGTLAFVIHGVLGVTKNEAIKDFLISWFDAPDETVTLSSINTEIVDNLKTYDSDGTFKQQCEAYLVKCGINYGLTEATARSKIEDFQALMLEEPETAAEAPLDDIGTAEEGDWGYRKTIGNEVAIVFTNHTKTVTWTVPENLENVKFLVVGGGGGGGEDSDVGNTHGGAGGGGGGVVTGLVDFAENSVVTITVGAGGNGGVRATQGGTNNKYGAAFSGEASSINVDGAEYVWAAGGGGDNGADESTNASKTKGNVGNDGGSSAGSRPGQTGCGAVIAPRVASVSDIKYADKSFGRQGGAGYYVTPADDSNTYWGYFSAAGGGGGATQAGGSAVDYTNAGNGGEGLLSSITGQAVVYGSGGGGATLDGDNGGKGGTGAGDGNTADVANGTASMDALPNQGGGGGGSARAKKTNSSGVGVGGNGGSGIVVLRYSIATDGAIAAPVIASKVYTGETLTADVESSEGYTVTKNDGGTDVGTYDVVLKLNEGYTWADLEGDAASADRTLKFEIAKATNEWTTEPSISLSSWITGATPGELNMGVAKFGTVTATMNGAAFTELPTAVGTYSIVCTVEGTSNYTALSETITFEITEVPVINPTEYGTADKAASTYTWRGYTGPWMYTTNWTATASGTYGVPNNGTYATADFPAALENEFTCTLNQNVSVKYAKFDAPNMNLVLDNATLTVTDRVSGYVAYEFGAGDNASASIEFRGASAGIVNSKSTGLAKFGVEESATDKVRCTVRFIVPATGWENTAPIRATGGDSSVYFWYDTKLVIDATALGVPAENEVKTALLATSTDGMYNFAKVEITCADGAKGSVAVDGTKLVLTVEADETTEPEEPQLTAVDAPVAKTELVYTGVELTGVEGGEGYTLTDNTATDTGTYEATATLADGYKWSDNTTAAKTISWSIAKATNEWTTEPSISLTEWTQGEEAGVLTAGVAKFGEVTSSMTELPTEVGSYTITYTVAENNNFNGLTKTIAFEIKAAVVVEPDPEEPGTGGEDPSEKPKLAIDAKFGYVLTGLGEFRDQAAVVFTNSAEAANWQVPRNLKNVEILAVGGGGGGGGHYYSSTAKNCQGGAGGGGGAVVTGFITELAADQVVNVTVGAGGAGGTATTSATTGAGKGGNGGNTVLKVGDVTYVTAYGGGGDGGYGSDGVANGGSNSGVRKAQTAKSIKSVTIVGADAVNLVSDIVPHVNKGGNGNSTTSGFAASGGGGAGGQGGGSPGSAWGGQGGFGYVSNITGSRVVYGAGGGGGSGKSNGVGSVLYDGDEVYLEGAGVSPADADGSAGLANQGGGGGGGSYKKNGGAGGSGIVILRFAYSEIDIPVDASADILPLISDKVYTGEVLSSGLVETYAYTVEELKECVNVGAKVVRATLNEGYVWADGTTERYKDFPWNILKQDKNVWVTAPFINVDSWGQTYTGNVIFHKADPLVGELIATLAKDDGEAQSFNGTLPSEPGTYKLIYKVEGTDNFSSLYWEKTFKIYESETFAGGYKVYGLGDNGDEVAVVFTSSANWTVPQNIKSARFLVVGGGGGGGADVYTDAASGGAGGGGGGVVTGEVDLTKDATVVITVGNGGAGGELGVDANGSASGSYYGGSKKGGDSSFVVEGVNYVTAFGGGNDQGTTIKDTNATDDWDTSKAHVGGTGGSNAGSRGGYTTLQSTAPTMGSVAEIEVLRNCVKYGNIGGKGCSEEYYGFPAAGGGGGADPTLGLGGDAGNQSTGFPGGKGGEGLASDITGAQLVYGSGGGGASHQGSLGGKGGTGAGDGGDSDDSQGASALPNQGGGGGGSSRETTYGGNGGSGIVVFRYVVAPIVDDGSVDAALVFESARVSKPILYPSEPEVITNTVEGVEVVTVAFGGVNAQVPDCYDIVKSVTDKGYQISLVIKDEFKNPVIANSENEDGSTTPAIKVENGKVTIHLEGAQFSDKLYYIFKRGGDLTDRGAWEACNMTTKTGDVQFDLNANDTAGFFEFIKVSDERITE